MSSNVSQNTVDWSSLAQSLVRSLSQQSRTSDAVGAQVAEVCAAAFASGFARGRWGKLEVGGVPIDLGAGVALHLLAWSGVAGERRQELHNLAEGALATYFATWGATTGKRVRDGEQMLKLPGLTAPAPNAGLGAPPLNGAMSGDALSEKDGELLQFIRTVVPS